DLITTAGATADEKGLGRLLTAVAPPEGAAVSTWHFAALSSTLDALDRRDLTLASLAASGEPDVREAAARCQRALDTARSVAASAGADQPMRLAAIRLLGRAKEVSESDVRLLGNLLGAQVAPPIQTAALSTLARIPEPR